MLQVPRAPYIEAAASDFGVKGHSSMPMHAKMSLADGVSLSEFLFALFAHEAWDIGSR